MSRWSADRLRVALAPGEIALARGTRRASLPAGQNVSELLAVLDDTLADTAWQAARVEVVLSQRFVRHVVTSPPGKALAPAEERALVLASLCEIYGETARDWRVRIHRQPPHAGVVGAALEGGLADALDSLLARRGGRHIALRPLASLAAPRVPKRLDGWWALAEPGWLTLFGSVQGCWRHVAAVPTDAQDPDALPVLVARECSGAAEPVPPVVWLQTTGLDSVAPPSNTPLRWHLLPDPARGTGAAAFLAL